MGGKLSAAEAKELEEDLRHDVNTRFGTRNENVALAMYERRSGTEVRACARSFCRFYVPVTRSRQAWS